MSIHSVVIRADEAHTIEDLLDRFVRDTGVAEVFVIDRSGIVRHKISGAKSPAHYRELVLPLLRE